MLALLVASPDPSANEQRAFLPSYTPYRKAIDAMRKAFPRTSGLSRAVAVFERRDGKLSPADLAAVEKVADALRSEAAGGGRVFQGVSVRSPKSILLADNPLISDDGQAALIIADIPFNFITTRCALAVDRFRDLADENLPEGLSVAVTGSSGFGRDYALAAQRSHERTFVVTIAAVIFILMLVYRAPIAALIPLGAISAAVFVAMKLLAIGENGLGLHIGIAERIFVFVLMYGAGTDYSLLLINRYRELLDVSPQPSVAAGGAFNDTAGAILASAGTDSAGLLMLVFADFGVFKTTGPAVALSLVVAMLASLTLVPAMLGVIGPKLFWPGHKPRSIGSGDGRRIGIGRHWLWPTVARVVVARPGLVLAITLALLAVPVLQNLSLPWVYDTLAEVSTDYDSRRGADMARRHWPIGEIAPVTVLIDTNSRPMKIGQWDRLSQKVTAAVQRQVGVANVRSLTQPVGKGSSLPKISFLRAAALKMAAKEYITGDLSAMRMDIALNMPAMTLDAMSAVDTIRSDLNAALASDGPPAGQKFQVHITGATAQTADVRKVTQRDFRLVVVLVLGVIFLIVLALLRDWLLTAFMVFATILGYLATLGITYWVFVGLLGAGGLDWKVEVFLFVVMVAVGVDYSIFIAARLAQEARHYDVKEATRRAVIHTGPVISSCGLIMAATLGSLMTGDLSLLVQLGFAFALGMLIDTFVVRPLLLPAFVVLTKHCGRRASIHA